MKKILIIEDDADVRENLAELLGLENYIVFSAENGKFGIELAQQHIPDLVLCDVVMPEKTGFDVYFELSKDLRTAGLPFIFLTGLNSVTDNRQGLSIGADDYVTKPFDPELLLVRIRNRIEKSEKHRQEISGHLISHLKSLESLLDMTSHKVRSPIAASMGLLLLLEQKQENLSEEQKRAVTFLKKNMDELDSYCRSVTKYLDQIREEKKGNQ